MDTPDRAIAELARRQHGAFTTAQAMGVGATEDRVRRRVAAGRWERRMRGVYVLAGVAPSLHQDAWCAQLSRADAVLSHLSAAVLAGLSAPVPPRPSLTVPPGTSSRSPLARVHRLTIPEEPVVRQSGLLITSTARTLVDCACLLGARQVQRLTDEALHLRKTSVPLVREAIAASPHAPRRATDALEAMLEVWAPRISPGSPAEARLVRLIASWDLPEPERQVVVRDASGTPIARLDAGWPDRRLGLEYDSVRWHGPAAWASDEARHRLLVRLGWRLERVDKADVGPGSNALQRRIVGAYHAAPLLGPVPGAQQPATSRGFCAPSG